MKKPWQQWVVVTVALAAAAAALSSALAAAMDNYGHVSHSIGGM
jgi:hypothetical protein